MSNIPWSKENENNWHKPVNNPNVFISSIPIKNVIDKINSGKLIEHSANELQLGVRYYLVSKDDDEYAKRLILVGYMSNRTPVFGLKTNSYEAFPLPSSKWKYYTINTNASQTLKKSGGRRRRKSRKSRK